MSWPGSEPGRETADEVLHGLVSVIIPVYNGAAFVGDAIASVLAQDGVRLEVVVVDDGSEDGSAEVAERFGSPVRCLRQANAGIAGARNAGVRATRGDLLAFLDADDLWTPGRLREQVDRLAAEPALDCVFGVVEHFRDARASAQYESRAPERAPGLLPGAMLIRRASFLRVGPFDPSWRLGEFIEWQLRAEERGLRHEVLPRVVLRRRVHDGNTTTRRGAERLEYLRVLRSVLHRRREGQQE
jgi:glycosyltransferase involved in cell wall biosynthesis